MTMIFDRLDRDFQVGLKLLNYLWAGLTLSLANPIDLVRFRMQTMPQLITQGILRTPYNSILDCSKRICFEEGASAFWKGNMSNLLKFYPSETLNWTFKEFLQSTLERFPMITSAQVEKQFVINSFCGASAGLLTRTLLYPFQYTRNKMSNDLMGNTSVFKCLKDAIKEDGIKRIYRGALVSFVGVSLFRSTFFGLYDTFKVHTKNKESRWLLSYFSAFCAILLTYPADTVRRRMMLTTSKSNHKLPNFKTYAIQIYQKEGIRGYFRGSGIIKFQSITSGTIYFAFDKVINDIKSIDQ